MSWIPKCKVDQVLPGSWGKRNSVRSLCFHDRLQYVFIVVSVVAAIGWSLLHMWCCVAAVYCCKWSLLLILRQLFDVALDCSWSMLPVLVVVFPLVFLVAEELTWLLVTTGGPGWGATGPFGGGVAATPLRHSRNCGKSCDGGVATPCSATGGV